MSDKTDSSYLQEIARRRAQNALREEAAIRDAMERQVKEEYEEFEAAMKVNQELDDLKIDAARSRRHDGPMAKKPRMSRAAKRLENCPGVKEPSASGKVMKALPEIWRPKQEPKVNASEDIKPKRELKLEEVAASVNDRPGADGSMAGLLGLNTTFSFSPLQGKDGKFLVVSSSQNFFTCISCYDAFLEVRNFIL